MKVVIIGAGVAGLGIGWRLVQAGLNVTVLERAQPASGASWAAAGMIAVTAELAGAPEPEILFAKHSKALWPGFTKELEQESGVAIGFRQNGALILGDQNTAKSESGLQWLNAAETRAKAPMLTGDITGALWAPQEAQVDNRALGRALVTAFLRAGGKLVPNEAVVRIERNDGRAAAARTPFGVYEADAFILAAGAWSALLEDAIPIVPVKGEMIALAPPPGDVPPDPVVWGNGVYAVPRGALLLIGATVEEAGFDTRLTALARRTLRARAEAILPGLKGWSLVDQWAGLRPRSPDGLPLLGSSGVEGLFVAGGQFRNGILFAPAVADHMRDLLLGRAAVIPAFDPQRFA